MADFKPNAAPASMLAGQPAFVFDLRFNPLSAAMLISAGQMSPVFDMGARPAAAAMAVLAGTPRFAMPDAVTPPAAPVLVLAGQPFFVMGLGNLAFDCNAVRIDLVTPAPTFTMLVPTPQRFSPGAAGCDILAGQPGFLGDLRIGAPPVYPFEWSGAGPLEETRGFATALQAFDDATEQRRRIRAVASGIIRVPVVHLDPQDFQHAQALLFARQGREIVMPRWQYGSPLTAQTDLGDYLVSADLTGVPFALYGWVVLWIGPREYELNVVADFDDASLTLLYPATRNYPAGSSRVLPAITARVPVDAGLTWEGLNAASEGIELTVERWTR